MMKKRIKGQKQIKESIERFANGFWQKNNLDRPPVGIVTEGIFLPIKFLRLNYSRTMISPEDLSLDIAVSDYEYEFQRRTVFSDDWIPFSTPWRAIPWLEAMCGCKVEYARGSLAAKAYVNSLNELLDIYIPSNCLWVECYENQIRKLISSNPVDCWISPSILRGPSDIIAAMRKLEQFYCDLYDDMKTIDIVASRVNNLIIDILKLHSTFIKSKLEGFGNFYGYWAPQQTVVIQEDAMGMCSPSIYKEIFFKYNADIVKFLGDCVLFHLHSTGYQHYTEVLKIPGISGIEFTIEQNGPSLIELIPILRDILERSRLILFVDNFFGDLHYTLRKLPREGLYVLISNKFISSENDFNVFIRDNWQ